MRPYYLFTAVAFLISINIEAQTNKYPASTPSTTNQQRVTVPANTIIKQQTYPSTVLFKAKITNQRFPIMENINKYNLVEINQGNGFNAETGIFKAPAPGLYCFLFNITLKNYGCYNTPVTFDVFVSKNDIKKYESYFIPVNSGPLGNERRGSSSQSFTTYLYLNYNETISLSCYASGCSGNGGSLASYEALTLTGYKVSLN